MAASGYTPIILFNSGTASNVPTTGNLAVGELAINYADGKLYYNTGSAIKVLAGAGGAGIAGGSNTQVQYNSSGNLAGSANMTFNGTSLTLANDASIHGLTVGQGGGSIASNTAVGYQAINSSATGTSNSAFGLYALYNLTSGTDNTGIGKQALVGVTGGNNNTGIGSQSLQNTTTGSYNSAVGQQALYSNTTASNNTAVGYQAGYSNTTSGQIVAVGSGALKYATGGDNVAVGSSAGGGTGNTGAANVLVGSNTGAQLTSGSYNVFVGSGVTGTNAGPGFSNTSGSYNVGLGSQALYNNTTASNNTAVGYQAGYSNTTANNNTAVGYQAAYSNTTADVSVYIGGLSGYSVTTGGGSAFLGYRSGYALTTGTLNTFIGAYSGQVITTGSKNTIIGGYQGNSGGLDIRTLSNYIVLSDGDGNPRGVFNDVGSFLLGGPIAFENSASRLQVYQPTVPAAEFSTGGGATTDAVGIWNRAASGDNQFIGFYTDTSPTRRGSITYNRGAGLVAYNVTSDYRAKDIYGPVENSGTLIDSVPVYMGKMKGATQERPMFIAHETPDYAHTGEKDAVDKAGNPVYQQMDASALIPVMWAEIQSLRARLKAANIA